MSSSKKAFWWLSFLFVLLGIGISVYLTQQHYAVLKTGFTGKTFCNINPYLNCDIVLSSRYSKVATLPLAGLGLVFYLYLLGSLIGGRMAPDSAPSIYGLPFLMLLFAVALSLFLAYVSLYQLRSFCIFCSALYLVNLVLFWSFKRLFEFKWREAMTSLKRIQWPKALVYLGAVFLIGSLLLHTTSRQFAKEPPAAELNAYVQAFFKQPVKNFDITGRPFWGNPDAKIIIVEFSDFECPYCKLAAFNLKPMLVDLQDKVKLVFLHFPLDQSCNVGMPKAGHKEACNMAFASWCAGEQGKFWEFHDEAFDRQPRFGAEAVKKIAKKVGLDMNKFQTCLSAESTKQAVESDIQQAIKADIMGTPAVYVNGRPLSAWQSKTILHRVIESTK